MCASSLISMNLTREQLGDALWAATSIEDVKRLINQGADVNYNMHGSTVLAANIARGNSSIVIFLLAHGAKPTAYDLKIAKEQVTLEANAHPMKRAIFRERSAQETQNRQRILTMIERAMER